MSTPLSFKEMERPAYSCRLGSREMHNFVARCYQQLKLNPQPSSHFLELIPAFYSLRLLSIFLRRSASDPISSISSSLCDGVLEHWSDVWKWLQCANVTCRHPRKHSSILDDNDHCALFSSITGFIMDCCLTRHLLHQKMKSTAIGIVVDLWYYQLRRPHHDLDPNGSTLQVLGDWLQHEAESNGQPFIISRIGRPVEEIAAAMLCFFKYHISSLENTIDHRPFVSYVRFMTCLSKHSSIRNAFMSLHSVHDVTRALVHLSYNMVSRPELNSDRCREVRNILTLYLLHTFLDMKGIAAIRRSVEAGLLLAVVRGGACDRGDNGEQLGILVRVMYPYLIYVSILRPAIRSLAKINVTRMEEQMDRQGKFWGSWVHFKKVFENRCLVVSDSGVTKYCDNTRECGRTDIKDNFKRCSGCQEVSYCSTRCQRVDWLVNGHRQHCKVIQRYNQEGEAGEPSADDLAVVRYLALEDSKVYQSQQHPTGLLRMISYTDGYPCPQFGDLDDNKGTILRAELPWGRLSKIISVNPLDASFSQ